MGKAKKNILYEGAKADYVNACEARERLEVEVDDLREQLRLKIALHGTLVTSCQMFALRMKELKP